MSDLISLSTTTLAVTLGIITSHLILIRIIKRESPLLFFGLMVAGSFSLIWVTRGYDLAIQLSALALSCAILIVYIETRFLLSRGISTRLLVDLLERGGNASVEELKKNYGQGMGIDGLLRKRLGSLAQLKILSMTGNTVGPLSFWGRAATRFFGTARTLLGLKLVG